MCVCHSLCQRRTFLHPKGMLSHRIYSNVLTNQVILCRYFPAHLSAEDVHDSSCLRCTNSYPYSFFHRRGRLSQHKFVFLECRACHFAITFLPSFPFVLESVQAKLRFLNSALNHFPSNNVDCFTHQEPQKRLHL